MVKGPGRPICILEGPDGGGKTTLADQLVMRGWEYGHCGPPEKDALRYYLDEVNSHGSVPAVIDRLHAGSYVYGKAFRGIDDLTEFEHWILDGYLTSRDGVMVYACPPFEVTQKNLERGPDNEDATIYEDPARRQLVRDLYEEYVYGGPFGVNQLETIHYDYTRGFMGQLVQILDNRRERGPTPVDSVPTLGNARDPALILVGDVPSGRTKSLAYIQKHKVNRPVRFMELASAPWRWEPPFISRSGRYLHLAMTSAKIGFNQACIFDATQFDGREAQAFLDRESPYWKHWQAATWVALGKNASDALDRAGVAHRTVPHPSWQMRTAYKDIAKYGKSLKEGSWLP